MAVDSRIVNTDITAGDAPFRAAIQQIEAALIACGAVVTADTGQIDPTTVVKPGAINTYAGYRIYRLSDSRQATKPVFFRLYYGTGSSLQYFRVNLHVGTGSNGLGTLLNPNSQQDLIPAGVGGNAQLYCSGGEGGIRIAWTVPGTTATRMAFGIERPRDPDTGLFTDDFIFTWAAWATSAGGQQVMLANGTWSSFSANLYNHMFGLSLAPNQGSTAAYLAVVPLMLYMGKLFHLGGLMAYKTGEIVEATTFTADILGVTHTFMAMGAWSSINYQSGMSGAWLWE